MNVYILSGLLKNTSCLFSFVWSDQQIHRMAADSIKCGKLLLNEVNYDIFQFAPSILKGPVTQRHALDLEVTFE